MKKIVIFFSVVIFLFSTKGFSQYFTEDFESAFVGTPGAPAGWSVTQTKTVPFAANEKDWQQNVWSGTAWSLTSSGNTNQTIGPKSGTGVLYIDDYNFFGATTPNQSRRMESPTVNLAGSTSPFLRFWYFNPQTPGQNSHIRVAMSSDGGTTWNEVAPILNGWDSVQYRWNRINIKVPAAYRVANFKFAFEITNRWGSANPFIDLVTVEEFTPSTIVSAPAGGNWNATTTWVGGVPPTSDNNVQIVAGATVTIPAVTGLVGRCQNIQIDGTLTFGATTTTAFCAFQDISVTGSGRINAFNGTSGRAVWCGGNFTNAGALNFAVPNATAANWTTSGPPTGASLLVMFGAGGTSYTNTGSLDSNRINNLWVISAGTVTINSPLTVPLTLGLYNGTLSHGGNLTLGNAGAFGQVQTIERHRGSLASDPTWNNTRIASRSNNYLTTNVANIVPMNLTPGNEVELVSGVRTTTGILLLNTFNNIVLGYPMTVGTTTTGTLTLTKGIMSTDATNILRVATFVAPPTGTAPSTTLATTTTSQGSYIYGPVRIDLPTSTASRNVPIGYGNQPNGNSVTQNKLLTFSLATITAWTAGTSVTVTPVGKPSGTANAPLSAVMGTRAYQITLNGGPDLSADAYISGLRGNNYTYGNGSGSDSLLGNQQNLFIAQSSALTGPWTVRSITSGTGAFVNNTEYTRNTATGAPGPISPIASNGGFFCWATNATANDITANSIIPSGSAYYQSLASPVTMTGTVKNVGLVTTSGTIYITRKIIGTAYSSQTTVPPGVAPNATANTTFADFTGWTAGVTYQIKDSVYMVGDGSAANDTLSAFFTPNIPKPILIYYGTDTRSRDSIVAHMAGLGLGSQYDLVASFSAGVPLSYWKTIVFLSPTGYTFTTNTATRDSLRTWLDGSTPSAKRSLVIFGDDIGYYSDPRRNASATAADTIFYRQYLHAAYWSDDWVDNFVASDSTLKGTGTAPWSTITGQRVNDPYPDCLQPAIWNSTGGTPQGVLFPVTESGDGDTCAAVVYNGTNYNTFYMSNVYYGLVPTVSGALSPQGVVLNIIKQYVEGVNGVFPVELASFTSSIDRRNVTLRWSTNSEENNAGFDVERKAEGTNEWVKAGNVSGAGNSNTIRNYTYSDNNLATGRYSYRLKQMDFNGNYKYYDLSNEVIIGVPTKFDISQNYPNPFNPSTKVNFDLPFDSRVQIKVFDMTGREIAQMLNETKTAGYYTVQFNASALASGVYFYQIQATGGNQSFVKTMKMVLVK